MQAPQYAPLHADYYSSAAQPTQQTPVADAYLAPDGAPNFTSGFSRGSSFTYPHQDYGYLLDRGELASRLCAASLVDNTFDATGLGFAGNPSSSGSFGAPEETPAYQQETWGWTGAPGEGIAAPAPVYAASPEPTYLASQHPSTVRSPVAQVLTPAAMALLLNPHGRSEGDPHPQQGAYEPPLTGTPVVTYPASASALPAARPQAIRPAVAPAVATQSHGGTTDSQSREKKHACTMCHKRFDRPSTLRKHLLVHTGEKAFVCDTCGRRFGVASNLNRHVKRCILKPVNTPSPSHKSSTSGSPASVADSPEVPAAMPPSDESRPGKRPRVPSSAGVSPTSPSSSSSQPGSTHSPTSQLRTRPAGQKRRRRAPSPSQWVPATLQNFNLLSDDSYRITSVPLPPVRPSPPKEERDSWDENVGHAPYHPCAWSGILPGPGLGHGLGLGGKDVRNLNLGGRGGFMLGRVMVF